MDQITKEQFLAVLPANHKKSVDDALLDSINNAIKNTETLEIFKDNILSFTGVLSRGKFNTKQYINAVKYVSFKLLSATTVEAYISAFPDKYQKFIADNVSTKNISYYAHYYHSSKLVQLIYAQTMIPVHVLNAPVFQEAVNTQAYLMANAKSELVRSNAANSLMIHLKPPEEVKLNLDIGVDTGEIIDKYQSALATLVAQQQASIAAGGDVKQIANIPINVVVEDDPVIDVTPEPDIPTPKKKELFIS